MRKSSSLAFPQKSWTCPPFNKKKQYNPNLTPHPNKLIIYIQSFNMEFYKFQFTKKQKQIYHRRQKHSFYFEPSFDVEAVACVCSNSASCFTFFCFSKMKRCRNGRRRLSGGIILFYTSSFCPAGTLLALRSVIIQFQSNVLHWHESKSRAFPKHPRKILSLTALYECICPSCWYFSISSLS